MEYSEASPKVDPSQSTSLPLDISQALGRCSPEKAWLELTDKALEAEDLPESQTILDAAEYRGDMTNLIVLMGTFSPVEGVTFFHRANPTFDLQNIQGEKPLVTLAAIVNMVMTSDDQ